MQAMVKLKEQRNLKIQHIENASKEVSSQP